MRARIARYHFQRGPGTKPIVVRDKGDAIETPLATSDLRSEAGLRTAAGQMLLEPIEVSVRARTRSRPRSISQSLPSTNGSAHGGRVRMVIAANRLPMQRVIRSDGTTWTTSPGGLVSAMGPVVQRRGSAWIGWDGGSGRSSRPSKVGRLSIVPVGLSRGDIEGYYRGFCNSTLWPLYHDAIQTPDFKRDWWEPYKEVNSRFARAIMRIAARGATVWIHDYHLQLVPRMLREKRPDLKIGFFLHIPFPPEEIFAWLPWRAAIIRGILGADLAAFQTEASASNFSRVARRFTNAAGTDHHLAIDDRRVRCLPIPISVDTAEFERLARSDKVRRRAAEIRRQLGNRRVLLSVDRLDYTKGLPHRLQAIEELFKEDRLTAEEVVHVQIAVPSREDSLGYEQVREEVERTVGRINGTFSEPGKVAVHYFRRSLSREELTAYYLAADVMVVTPLRDGMNLVAKEYCACRVGHPGVLVLSEFAGAARELRRALLVNPRDIETFKSVLVQAVRMPAEEARMRMAVLRMQVRRHNVFDWAESFLDSLSGRR